MRRFLPVALLLLLSPLAMASDWYQFSLAPAGSSVRSCGTFTMTPGGSWSVFCTAAANINTHCTDFGCSAPSCVATASNIPLGANQVYLFNQTQDEAGIAIIGTATCNVANHWPPPPQLGPVPDDGSDEFAASFWLPPS